MGKDIYEFKMVPKMPKDFTKVTYRGFVIPCGGKWYYGKNLKNGNLCATNGWEVNGLTHVHIQHEKGGKFEPEWIPLYDDDGTQLLRIAENDLTRIKVDLKEHVDHVMDFDDWLLSNEYDYGNLDDLTREELDDVLDDYDYYLYDGNKYPYFVRKIVEKELEKKENEVENVNKLRSYKEYESISLGGSDIAALTFTGYTEENGLVAKILDFGSDGSYKAYLVDEYAEIGSHYELELEFDSWVNVYDDTDLVETFKADYIKVYRAGDFGCIIQLIGKH